MTMTRTDSQKAARVLPDVFSTPNLSSSTQSLLENMIKQTSMSRIRQKELLRKANISFCLPLSMKRQIPTSARLAYPAISVKTKYDEQFKLARRSQIDIIRACDNYQQDMYKGLPAGLCRDKEIERLQRAMSKNISRNKSQGSSACNNIVEWDNCIGDDENDYEKRRLTRTAQLHKRASRDNAQEIEEINEADELLGEIRERREWLKEMEQLGTMNDKLRMKVNSEIKARLTRLDKISSSRENAE